MLIGNIRNIDTSGRHFDNTGDNVHSSQRRKGMRIRRVLELDQRMEKSIGDVRTTENLLVHLELVNSRIILSLLPFNDGE